MREALFDAQRGAAARRGRSRAAASRARSAPTAAACARRSGAPTRPRTATCVAGLRGRAPRATDGLALAAARGTVQAALLPRRRRRHLRRRRRAGDAATARALAAAARVPHADPLHAPRRRRDGRAARPRAQAARRPRKARLAVVKDLLDSTQGEARERLDEIGRLGERGFAAHRAELAAQVAGAWPLLAPRYRAERGAAAEREAAAAVAELRAAALRDDDAAVEAARADVAPPPRRLHRGAVHRRGAGAARQPAVEVRLADPGRVRPRRRGRRASPSQFEIQEGLAFSTAAQAAFADLDGHARRGSTRARPRTSTRRLEALDAVLRGAQESPERRARGERRSRPRARRSASASRRSSRTPGRSSPTRATST